MFSDNYPDLAALIKLTRHETSGISLRAGQIIKAIVIAQDIEGKTLLNINGKEVQAQLQTPVEEGQTLLLKVEQGGRQPVLKLVNTLIPTENSLKLVTTVFLNNRDAGEAQFRPGHLLHGSVQSVDPEQNITLRINNALFQARTQYPVSIGQQLNLQVIEHQDQVALRILSSAPTPDTVNRTLRTILPQTEKLSVVFAKIAELISAQRPSSITGETAAVTSAPTVIPQRIQQLAHELLVRLPDTQQVSNPTGLKQAIQDSGLFLEHKLAREVIAAAPQSHTPSHIPASISNDLKGGFYKLLINVFSLLQTTSTAVPIESLQQSLPGTGLLEKLLNTLMPGHNTQQTSGSPAAQAAHNTGMLRALLELFRHIESGVSRVQLHQISSLPTEDRPQTVLSMEIPVRHGESMDVIELRIGQEKEDAAGRETRSQWSATLLLNLQHLGQIRARITVIDKAASTVFWADKASTAELINQHLPELHDNMSKAGLRVGRLECSQGLPAEPGVLGGSRVLVNTTA